MRRLTSYIYQQRKWPEFEYEADIVYPLLSKVRHAQGMLIGKMQSLGFELRKEATLETLTLDVLKSSEIEGEKLDLQQVRSSIARRLGVTIPGMVHSERDVEGVVEMMVDATQNFASPLSAKRLFDWHSALFPTGKSGMYKIRVGKWRDDSTGPMQVVSGALGKERVHFQAPQAEKLEKEMKAFLNWLNKENKLDLVLKAAIAHLWFITLHPFDDGNGRIARAITDKVLAQSDNLPQRYYSMSAQIRSERKLYYEVLETTQKGSLDITEWIVWFLNCLSVALHASDKILSAVLYKHNFWNKNATQTFNDRQVKMLNKLLEGFTGKLTSSKWAKMTKCSADTALRDINDLLVKKVLCKEASGGRSTNYELNR
jgi:Fic family protein